MREYYHMHKILNGVVIIGGFAILINTIVGIHLDWQYDIYLDQLTFGFYLWLSSVIITFGVLFYLNFKYKNKNFNIKNLSESP